MSLATWTMPIDVFNTRLPQMFRNGSYRLQNLTTHDPVEPNGERDYRGITAPRPLKLPCLSLLQNQLPTSATLTTNAQPANRFRAG
jgi:hypothetical protein